MIDIQLLRDNPENFREATKNKNKDVTLIDRVLQLDEQRRKLLGEIEELRAQRNKIAKEGKASEEGKQIKEELKTKEPELKQVEVDFNQILKQIPNLYSDDTPVGKDESENKIIRTWGEPTKFDFEAKDHVALAEALELIEIEKASQITGARFAYLMGDLARLEFALVQFAFDTLIQKGFIPVVPPVMMKPEVMEKMARLEPKEERYYIAQADLYLVGSAEHTLGPLLMDQTLNESDLPKRYVGFSTSFREEAGSYGKDTRGILRVHQFDKVEMEVFSTPRDGIKEQDFIVGIQEELMQALKIPYQVVQICTGDMGGPDFRQIDIESWMPGQNKYRETHTSDYMTDYQARRLNTRVRIEDKTEYVHMNDATAFAIGRTLIAIIENYQQADGSILIPEVLQKWMGKDRISKS